MTHDAKRHSRFLGTIVYIAHREQYIVVNIYNLVHKAADEARRPRLYNAAYDAGAAKVLNGLANPRARLFGDGAAVVVTAGIGDGKDDGKDANYQQCHPQRGVALARLGSGLVVGGKWSGV